VHSPLRHVTSVVAKRRPIHLTFFATRRCNARCPFCFYERARDAADDAPELGAAEVRRLAGSLGPLLWVLFSGGEPFLRRDLVELAAIFHDVSRAAFLTFPTNGLLPEVVAETTEAILERCRDAVVVVKLSLDGVGADHDAIRRVPGGFVEAMRTVERLASLARAHPRLEVGVNTLFCSETQHRIDGIVDFVRGLDGVRSHTITLVRPGASDRRFEQVDPARYARAVRRLEAAWRAGPDGHRFAGAALKAAQDRVQRRLVHRTMTQGRRVVPCYAGRLNLVLTERGELHPCESRWSLSFGNVRDAGYDVRAMLRSARGRAVAAEVERGACWCAHECNLLTNILFNPGTQPALAREWARLGTHAATGDGRPGQEAIA
jgi:MoaA/NifB/PqqE/SkfB family radical SAM enzyme